MKNYKIRWFRCAVSYRNVASANLAVWAYDVPTGAME